MKKLFFALIKWIRTRTWQIYILRCYSRLDISDIMIDVGGLFVIHRIEFERRFTFAWLRLTTHGQFNLVLLGLGIHINSFSAPGALETKKVVWEFPGVGLWWKGIREDMAKRPVEPFFSSNGENKDA